WTIALSFGSNLRMLVIKRLTVRTWPNSNGGEIELLLDYIRNLVPFMQYNDFFSLFWTISHSHVDLNSPQFLDKPILNLLKLFDRTNILNTTVIFLMSAHGFRMGDYRLTHQGELEDMEPPFAAKFIVDEINQILEPHLTKCAQLKLHLIRHASFMSNAIRFAEYHPYWLQDVFVQLQTEPGYGIFEATVRSTTGRTTLSDDITRINRYENQSYCVNDANLKKFCRCNLLTTFNITAITDNDQRLLG
ncbi:hypothetical protein GQX74_001114, partial [Glossina fuscipes]